MATEKTISRVGRVVSGGGLRALRHEYAPGDRAGAPPTTKPDASSLGGAILELG